jgi:hypothetical protein
MMSIVSSGAKPKQQKRATQKAFFLSDLFVNKCLSNSWSLFVFVNILSNSLLSLDLSRCFYFCFFCDYCSLKLFDFYYREKNKRESDILLEFVLVTLQTIPFPHP